LQPPATTRETDENPIRIARFRDEEGTDIGADSTGSLIADLASDSGPVRITAGPISPALLS